MTAAAKTTTLAQALAAAQAEMPAVAPDKVNPHFKSKFVSLDHLIARTRPVLNKHGLAIVQMPAVSELGQPVLRTTISHEQGETVSADAPLYLLKQDMQSLGAAITYMRRFAWASACGISGEDDDDGESTVDRRSQPATAAKREPAAASDATLKLLAATAEFVKDRGGDVEAFNAAVETARRGDQFEEWLQFQHDHWKAQPKPSEFRVPAGVT